MNLTERVALRKMSELLASDPIVLWHKIRYDSVTVMFKDGIREKWRRYKSDYSWLKMPEDPLAGGDVSIQNQFQFEERNPKLFLIRYKSWKHGSFYEKRMVIHRLICRLLEEGWLDVDYPKRILVDDLEKLHAINPETRYYYLNTILSFGQFRSNIRPGRLLAEQLLAWDSFGKYPIRNAWSDRYVLRRAISKILRLKQDVTRISIFMRLKLDLKYRTTGAFIDPGCYRLIYRKFGLIGQLVADPYPGLGSKALAAAMEGVQYYTNKSFDRLSSFLNSTFYPLERDHYDAVLLDRSWCHNTDLTLKDLNAWYDKADAKVIFMPVGSESKFPKPDRWLYLNPYPRCTSSRNRICVFY